MIVLQFVAHLLGDSIVELMASSSKRTYVAHQASQVCCSQSPCPRGRSLLTLASAGNTQILKGRLAQSLVGPGGHRILLASAEHLWQVWDLILNATVPLLPSCWGSSFASYINIYHTDYLKRSTNLSFITFFFSFHTFPDFCHFEHFRWPHFLFLEN